MKISLRPAFAARGISKLPTSPPWPSWEPTWSIADVAQACGGHSQRARPVVRVGTDVLFGFVATAVAVAGFLGWTWRELRRVDRVIERRERRD